MSFPAHTRSRRRIIRIKTVMSFLFISNIVLSMTFLWTFSTWFMIFSVYFSWFISWRRVVIRTIMSFTLRGWNISFGFSTVSFTFLIFTRMFIFRIFWNFPSRGWRIRVRIMAFPLPWRRLVWIRIVTFSLSRWWCVRIRVVTLSANSFWCDDAIILRFYTWNLEPESV